MGMEGPPALPGALRSFAVHTDGMRKISGWALVALQAVLLIGLVVVPRAELGPVRGILGLVLILGGVALGLVAGMRLGSALTPTPVPLAGASLRTTGPFSLVRHPIYTAVLLAAVGYTVAIGSWWTVLVLGLLTLFFIAKSRWEDHMLREIHGDKWTAWARTTGALVPRRITPR